MSLINGHPGFTDFFMSPITGRIILPMFPDINEDYIWIGGRGDRPIESPVIIDLRLEIIDLRRRLSETRFILQAASPNFDSSQALNELVNGILKHEFGVVSIATPGTDYLAPILPYQNIWIGDIANTPQPNPRIFVNNLPHMGSSDPTLLFGAYNLYSGSPNPLTLGEPQIIKTLHITNMADLPVGHLWLGQVSLDPLNLGLNRPVPIIVLPLANMADLPEGKIWRGDGSDRPVPSDDLTDIENEIEEINEQISEINIEIGDINLNIDSIFDHLAEIDVHLGDIDIHLGDIDTHLGDIETHLGDIDIHLGDIDTHLGDIDVHLGDIDIHLGSLDGSIVDLQAQIDTNVASGLDHLADLQLQIDTNVASGLDHLADLQAQIDTNVASGLDHLANLQFQIDSAISSGMDHLATINAALDAINLALSEITSDITTINTTIIDIQNDITTINSTIVDIQSDITDIQTDITTINSTIVTIQAAIVDLEDTVGDGSVTLTGGVTGTGFVGTPFATTVATPLNNIPLPTANVSLNNFRIINLNTPVSSQDAATKGFVDSSITTLTAYVDLLAARPLNDLPVPTNTLDFNHQSVINILGMEVEDSIRFTGVTTSLVNAIAFPNSAQVRRVVLWNDNATQNDFQFSGLGTASDASILYHANVGASHTFYAGLTSTTKTLIANFSATLAAFSQPVSINIGSSSSIALTFNAAVNRCKIALYPVGANSFQVYGFGVLGSTLVYSVDSTASSHVFFAATSSTTANEVFRIHGTGYASVAAGAGTFYSRVPSAHVQMTGNATTTTCTANVWIKAAGTTTATSGAVQFTTATTNRLTFTGSQLGTACVGMASATATVAVTNLAATRVGLAIYKNGTLIQNAPGYDTTNASGSTNSPTLLVVTDVQVSLSPTDYIEAWVLAGNNTVMTVTNLNLSFKAI